MPPIDDPGPKHLWGDQETINRLKKVNLNWGDNPWIGTVDHTGNTKVSEYQAGQIKKLADLLREQIAVYEKQTPGLKQNTAKIQSGDLGEWPGAAEFHESTKMASQNLSKLWDTYIKAMKEMVNKLEATAKIYTNTQAKNNDLIHNQLSHNEWLDLGAEK